MGYIGSMNVDHNASLDYMKKCRSEGKGKDFLVMGIRDQNMLAKVYFNCEFTSDSDFIATIDAVLTQSSSFLCFSSKD